jgi:peptide/nickel transport system permease protein
MSALAEPVPIAPAVRPRRAWKEGLLRPGALFGLIVLGVLVILALLTPTIAPYDEHTRVGEAFAEPSSSHWLGLDDGGVDMLTLMMWGSRVSLLVGFAAAGIAVLIGGTIGILSGYFGGRTDTLFGMLIGYFLVIPDVPLIIVVAAIWGSSLTSIIIIIGLLYWTFTARVIRAQVKSISSRVYVERAQAVGVRAPRIIRTHVLPQVAPLLIAMAILAVSSAIFAETAISFLGLGDPLRISWGRLLSNGFRTSAVTVGAWWAVVPEGIAVALVILSCTMIGRSLEDALNPRLRVSHLSVRRFRVREVPVKDA